MKTYLKNIQDNELAFHLEQADFCLTFVPDAKTSTGFF